MSAAPGWVLLPPAFLGKRVFLLGGGPSIAKLNGSIGNLPPERTMACNATALLVGPSVVRWAVFGDMPFLRAFRPRLRQYVEQGGVLINASGRPIREENHWMLHVKRINGRKAWGVIQNGVPTEVSWNRSTGGCAVNIAVAMGAVEVVLIGYDMQRVAKRHNWHREYLSYEEKGILVTPPKNIYRDHFIRPFTVIMQDLERIGVQLWTTCKDSGLAGVVPYKPLEELL